MPPALHGGENRVGGLVQTNGSGLSLVSAMKRLMAACRSTIDAKTPRCRVSLANRPSTALAQEQEVGVKWKVKRRCRCRQAITPAFARQALWMLVGGVVVENRVDGSVGRHLALDGIEKRMNS